MTGDIVRAVPLSSAAAREAVGSTAPNLQWLKRDGRRIVDERGDEVFLRGVGLGNWLMPEGYMWLFGDDAASATQIERLIEDLVGPLEAEHFWRRYYDTYITESDIRAIKGGGFNSIRLPVNARLIIAADGGFLEDGFELIDRAVRWCSDHALYVVLDLHGAPGGQTGTNIDDSAGWPNLFTHPRNQELTIELWTELARRYRNNPAIAGYDLLNEPLPGDHRARYTHDLVRLYKELIRAIRTVDERHLIILEGTNWSNDWSIFEELWDDQVVLQFHKYWNAPDLKSIQKFLTVRAELEVPIWLGESGENTLSWYQGTFGLCDELGIGWNFWQWKKLGTRVSPVSIRVPDRWDLLTQAAAGGARPSMEAASAVLTEFLDNILLERCENHPEVLNSILRRAPLRLHAEHFGHRGAGVSWHAVKRRTTLQGFRDDDGPTIAFASAGRAGAPEFGPTIEPQRDPGEQLHVELSTDEWVDYEIETTSAGGLTVQLIGDLDADVVVTVDGEPLAHEQEVPARFQTSHPRPSGSHTIRVQVVRGRIRLRALDVSLVPG